LQPKSHDFSWFAPQKIVKESKKIGGTLVGNTGIDTNGSHILPT